MIKKILTVSFCLLSLCYLSAQNNCDVNLEKAKLLLKRQTPFGDQQRLFKLIEPCALEGHAEAENALGIFYANGMGIEKDTEKAYNLITTAAQKGYPEAQYNLGMLHKLGIGCSVNFKEAVTWFKKATANGNQKAAFALGYMHYKGHGIAQDYKQAIHWFNQSDDAMASHYLGICHYLGYGVPANDTKAVEYLSVNKNFINSKTLLNYVEAEQKAKLEVQLNNELTTTQPTDSTYIQGEVIVEDAVTFQDAEIENHEALTQNDITGEWVGKLIEYDWSKTHIVRIAPIRLNLTAKNNKIQIESSIDNVKLDTATAQWKDQNLYIENDLNFTLNKFYSSNPNELSLTYRTFSIGLQKKTVLGKTYLTGTLDTFIEAWVEYGTPMRIVVRPKNETTLEDDTDIALLEALATQEDQFIKLYPVPFSTQLTVQYELDKPATVMVELVSLSGHTIVLAPEQHQPAGEHLFTVPTPSSLLEGLYVVRLHAGDQLYTRMILKDNTN